MTRNGSRSKISGDYDFEHLSAANLEFRSFLCAACGKILTDAEKHVLSEHEELLDDRRLYSLIIVPTGKNLRKIIENVIERPLK